MHPLKSRTAPPLELKCTPSDLELHPLKIVSIKVRVLCHKNPTNIVGFFVASEEEFLRNKIRGPRGILCTRGEKEHTNKRMSIIAPDNAISKAQCATCARGYAAEPPITGLTASEERSKRLHLRKSSAADIANNRTRSVKCRALARKRGC